MNLSTIPTVFANIAVGTEVVVGDRDTMRTAIVEKVMLTRIYTSRGTFARGTGKMIGHGDFDNPTRIMYDGARLWTRFDMEQQRAENDAKKRRNELRAHLNGFSWNRLQTPALERVWALVQEELKA